MKKADVLIENGTILTMDPARRILKDSSVAISGGKIVEVGPADELRASYSATSVIDARRKVVMPGLIDLHGHAGTSLLKGIGEHLPGLALRNVWDFVEQHVSPEWWYLESLLASLERLKSGTTCSLHLLGVAPRGDAPEYPIKNVEGIEKIGIRGIAAAGPSRPPWPHHFTTWKNGRREDRLVSMEEVFEATGEAIRAWKASGSSRTQIWIGASRLLNPTPSDGTWNESYNQFIRPQADGIRGIMEKYGVGFHVHAFGTTVKYADEEQLGLLGPNTVLAHCWPLDLESVDIVARTGASVAHCPRSRRPITVAGRCPVPEMIDAGVTVGLGSDATGIDRTASIWEDMFMAARWQRFMFQDGWLLPPGKVLEMATIDGAKALRMNDRIGSVEAGKDADLIVVNMFQPHLAPMIMEPHRLAYYVRASDVDTVLVEGEILMEDRQVKTVNETEILERAQEEVERTIKTFGLEPLLEQSDRYWGHSRD